MRPVQVVVAADAAATIAGCVDAAGPVETGGLLLGWRRTDEGLIVVAQATGPGANATMSRYGLVLDVKELQTDVDEAWERSGGDIAYLGDWHLHHEHDPRPSGTDRRSAAEIAASPAIGVPAPLIMIVGEPPDGKWRAWIGPGMDAAGVRIEHAG